MAEQNGTKTDKPATEKPAKAAGGKSPIPGGGRKKTVPENETAAQRGKRLAGARMPKLKKALASIKALSGRGYEFSEKGRKQIADDVEAWSKEVVRAFREPASPAQKAADGGYTVED